MRGNKLYVGITAVFEVKDLYSTDCYDHRSFPNPQRMPREEHAILVIVY